MCARRRSNFLLLRQKKVTKEKATLLSVSPTLCVGATCDARAGGVPWNSLRCYAASFRQPRQARARSMRVLRHACHPLRCASQHGQKGTRHPTSTRAVAALGLALRGAKRRRPSGPSAAMARADFKPLVAAPAAGRLRGGMRVGARMLRELTRRGCSSGARSAKRVPRRTPQAHRRRFAPERSAGVADLGAPFFWVLFFGEAKKSTSPAGARPGLRPQPNHTGSYQKDSFQRNTTKRERQKISEPASPA